MKKKINGQDGILVSGHPIRERSISSLRGIIGFAKPMVLFLIFLLPNVYWGIKYASSTEPAIKIGYVDLQRAARESIAGKKAFEQLKREFTKKQAIIDRRQQEIEALQNEIKKKASILTEESRKEKEELYMKKLKELKRFVDDSNQELDKQERELTKKILIELMKVIDKLGKEQQYTLIIERQEGLLYASKQIDLTEEVMRRYDQLKQF
jgi:outer membrane protein